MRVLTLEGFHFGRALREHGCQVLSVGWHHARKDYDVLLERTINYRDLVGILEERGFAPELVVWDDVGYPPRILGFEALDAVVLGLSIDQYCNPWHVPFSAAFDACLVAQKGFVGLFHDKALPRSVEWFPLFCDPIRDRDPGLVRDIPASFVGTLDHPQNRDRRLFIEAFKRAHPLVVRQGAYVELFGRSRLVLNQSAAGELNFRLFEAAACGAAVLTEASDHGLEDLFTPGVDIPAPYARGDAADAAAKARAALADPVTLAAVAHAGQRKVLAAHTVDVRAARLLELARGLAAQGAPARRLAMLETVRLFMATAFGFIAGERESALAPEARALYARLAGAYERRWDSV